MGVPQHPLANRAAGIAAAPAVDHCERHRRARRLLLDASGFLAFLAGMTIGSALAVLLIGVPVRP